MSFLEMLDVVNEELIAKGEDPIAFDHDCREGICGTCGLVINGDAARPAARHDRLPAPHAQLQGRRRDLRSSRGAPPRSRSSRTWSSTAARSTASSRPAATSPSPPAAPPTPTPCWSRKQDADSAMDAAACIGCGACVAACPNASAMLFTRPRSRTSACCPRASPSANARALAWSRRHDRGGLRALHEHRRVRGRLPEGDQHRRSSPG